MLPVEIVPVQETLVLRARGSELLILPHHVKHLKGCEKPKDFSAYFRAEALVNRPARKLFEAWLRKDESLWKRLYICIHREMELKADGEDSAAEVKTPKVTAKAKAEVKPATKDEKKEAKTVVSKTVVSKPAAAKPVAEKPAAKEVKKEVKVEAKAKPEAKPAAKKETKAVKEADKPAKKAAKKVTKAKVASEAKPAAKKKTKTASAGTAKKKKG